MRVHFIGVGGSGISALAHVLCRRGADVSGSDRSYDQGKALHVYEKLQRIGIKLYPQDGSGVSSALDYVVSSTAVESTIPDIAEARKLGLPHKHRSELLAELTDRDKSIAIAGTSGKSTVTGMIGFLLDSAGLDPTILSGGAILNYQSDLALGNARNGTSEYVVFEADESDGTLINYHPSIGIITNLSQDHKTLPELRILFRKFCRQVGSALIINGDCRETDFLRSDFHSLSYGFKEHNDVIPQNLVVDGWISRWQFEGQAFELNLPGLYNVENALAAIAVGKALGIKLTVIADALSRFRGVHRRMELVGRARGVTVIDDFAHNPSKIAASIQTLKQLCRRMLLIYQFHGYGPARFMKDEFIDLITRQFRIDDVLFLPEIYYAGGTVTRNIHARQFADLLRDAGKNAYFYTKRETIAREVAKLAQEGDHVVVMGARDDTLPGFARDILKAL